MTTQYKPPLTLYAHPLDFAILATRPTGNADDHCYIHLDQFLEEVNRRAESKMLKTGKLEGSHYAAMQQLAKELKGKK